MRRLSPLAAAAAAAGLPLTMALAWWLREAPPAWSCEGEPPGPGIAVEDWRVGLGPAFGLGAVALVGLAARLSLDRRRAAGLEARPGFVTVAVGAPLVFYALAVAVDTQTRDTLPGVALIVLVCSPFGLAAAIGTTVWALRREPPVRSPAGAAIVVWASLAACILVAAGVMMTGTEGLCMD